MNRLSAPVERVADRVAKGVDAENGEGKSKVSAR